MFAAPGCLAGPAPRRGGGGGGPGGDLWGGGGEWGVAEEFEFEFSGGYAVADAVVELQDYEGGFASESGDLADSVHDVDLPRGPREIHSGGGYFGDRMAHIGPRARSSEGDMVAEVEDRIGDPVGEVEIQREAL